MDLFSADEDEKLIQFVSRNPALYNKYDGYTDYVAKDKLWKEISKELDKSIDSCKKHWKVIRDGYSRFKRKNNLESVGEVPKIPGSKWYIYQLLSFLDSSDTREKHDYSCDRETSRNEEVVSQKSPVDFGLRSDSDPLNTEDDSFNIPESFVANTSQKSSNKKLKSVKRRRTKREEQFDCFKKKDESHQLILNVAQNNDDLDSFAAHVKDVLKKFPPALQIRAKKELFETLTKYEVIAMEQGSSFGVPIKFEEE